MATFDGWDAPYYGYSLPNGQDTLMHYRTKGSKNGVRRYQTESGEWTPLGLRLRKAREGWGDKGERKAASARANATRMREGLEADKKMRNNPDLPSYMHSRYDRVIKSETKKVIKAERKADRAEKRQVSRTARAQRMADFREKRRQNSIKGLTDAELQKKISRLKMEQEYRELAKNPVLKVGEKLISSYMNYRNNKEQREIDRNKQIIEMERIKTEKAKAVSEASKAKSEAKKARSELKKARTKSAKKQAIANLVNYKNQAKRHVADNTIRGGLKKRINAWLSSGYSERKAENRYVSGVLSGARRTKMANGKRDVWEQLGYTAPDREQFFKNKKQNNGGDDQKKKKGKG